MCCRWPDNEPEISKSSCKEAKELGMAQITMDTTQRYKDQTSESFLTTIDMVADLCSVSQSCDAFTAD